MEQWNGPIFSTEEAVLIKQEFEDCISRGNSAEYALSVIQERYVEKHADEDDVHIMTAVYVPLAALALQYNIMQEDIRDAVFSLLAQGGSRDYPADAVHALKHHLSQWQA